MFACNGKNNATQLVGMARIYRKIERSATEQAEIEKIRSAPKDGATTGDKVGSQGCSAIMKLISQLRARREESGISQIELAERMGIEASALCRLETFKVVNPSAFTLLHWGTQGNACRKKLSQNLLLPFPLREGGRGVRLSLRSCKRFT